MKALILGAFFLSMIVSVIGAFYYVRVVRIILGERSGTNILSMDTSEN